MPGELVRFLQDLGLALPGEPPAQVGVLLRGRHSLTEIVSPGNIPVLPASSAQIVSEFIGLAIAVPDGRTAEETAGQMVLDLSERDLHLNGTQAEMSGEVAPVADPAAVPSGPRLPMRWIAFLRSASRITCPGCHSCPTTCWELRRPGTRWPVTPRMCRGQAMMPRSAACWPRPSHRSVRGRVGRHQVREVPHPRRGAKGRVRARVR